MSISSPAGTDWSRCAVPTPELTLPHPYAHLRAFVLIPWLAVDPAARLWVTGLDRPVTELLAELDARERDGSGPPTWY